MASQKIRVFMVEDSGTERSSIKSLLEYPEYDEQLEFYFWGEHPGEGFDRSEHQVQAFIENNQKRFDVIVLDHCWNEGEEAAFRELSDLSLSDIRNLDDSRCPSSVRLLRLFEKANVNQIPILVFTWYGYPRWAQYVQQDLGADWTMNKDRKTFDDLPQQIMGIHKYRQKVARAQLGQLSGSSRAVTLLRQQMKEALRADIGHIFLSGPAGSGKELVADILGRALAGSGPFVPFAASAIPETLIEAELFGCEQDYPNSGQPARPGAFRSAAGGVLFLDEILDLPVESQPKLLRTLAHDPPEIQVLGAGRSTLVDVRLIVATNLTFQEALAAGRLREEFAQRIERFFPVKVPPLSERREDIPDLAKQFCREASRIFYRFGIELTNDALSAMQEADWSNGNARALKACVFKLVGRANRPTIDRLEVEKLFADDPEKELSTFRQAFRIPKITKDGIDLAQVEREAEIAFLTPILEDALRICRGFQSKAAPLLGLTTDQLAERIRKCGIDARSFRG